MRRTTNALLGEQRSDYSKGLCRCSKELKRFNFCNINATGVALFTMTKDKQIQANTKNSQLGGVKTDKGKAITKYNATKHGVLTKVLNESEKEIAWIVYEQLKEEYNPQTFTEELQIQNAAVSFVRLQRAIKAEQEYMPSGNTEINIGYQAEFGYSTIVSLSGVYLRYIITCEHSLNRALHELQRIQSERKGQTVPPPSVLDVSIDTTDKSDKILEQENGFVS